MQKYTYNYQVIASRLAAESIKVSGSYDVLPFIQSECFKDCNWEVKEYFFAIYLDASLHIKGYQKISEGGLTYSIADLRLIFKGAIDTLSVAMIITHNHPSCDCRPSAKDKELTKKIYQACKLLDIRFMDHIIVSHDGDWFSFEAHGLLNY